MEGDDEFSRRSMDPIEEASRSPLHNHRSRCCFFFRCFKRSGTSSASPSSKLTWWQKIRAANNNTSSLWARGVDALKKIREWSEIVAGPRWKTFIRRFNRHRSGGNKHVNLQYDPLSYALNFDEGPGQNSNFDPDGEDGYYYASRNFSSRYAKGSMDFGKDGGPTFV